RHVWHGETDVIEGGAACWSGWFLFAQEDERVGKLDDVDAAELHCSAADRVDPELPVGFDARDVQVIVPNADLRVGVTQELSESRRCSAEQQHCQSENSGPHYLMNGFHPFLEYSGRLKPIASIS